MTNGVPQQFAAIKTMLEEMHGFAIEGQHGENSQDMQEVLASHLRYGSKELNSKLRRMSAVIRESGR